MDEFLETADGSATLQSARFGVTYHSIHGAVQESRVVFIEAGLQALAAKQGEIKLLELGLGTGLNVLLSLLEAERLKIKLHYTAMEAYPIVEALLPALQANYSAVLQEPRAAAWLERIHLGSAQQALSPLLDFERRLVLFEDLRDEASFDLIYFDAFAPSTQPHLWEEGMLAKVYRALKPGGLLTTYCAKGCVKRALRAQGFSIEALPGPPGKREMTRAWKS